MTIFVARGQNLAFPRSLPKVKYYFTPYKFIGHINLNKVIKFDSCLTNTHPDILYLTCLGSRVTPFRVMRVKPVSSTLLHGYILFIFIIIPYIYTSHLLSCIHMWWMLNKNLCKIPVSKYLIFTGLSLINITKWKNDCALK